VRVGPEQGGQPHVVFEVRDTGVGIPLDRVSRLFKPFSQADTSTTRRYGGTGLGLTISAQLVELMGGHIWVDSEPGRGSRFHFVAHFGLQQQPTPPAGVPSAANLRGLRVLVVDDNATNRVILEEMLASWQMQPKTVASAQAALAELSQAADDNRPYHLVLTDALMPDVDGFTLARQIGADKGLGGVKVILLTSAGLPPRGRGRSARSAVSAWAFRGARPGWPARAERHLSDVRVTRDKVKKLLPHLFHVTEAGAYGNEAPVFFGLEKPHQQA